MRFSNLSVLIKFIARDFYLERGRASRFHPINVWNFLSVCLWVWVQSGKPGCYDQSRSCFEKMHLLLSLLLMSCLIEKKKYEFLTNSNDYCSQLDLTCLFDILLNDKRNDYDYSLRAGKTTRWKTRWHSWSLMLKIVSFLAYSTVLI